MSKPNPCPSCGRETPEGASICPECNFPLAGVPMSASAPAPPPPPKPEPAPEPEPASSEPPVRGFDPGVQPFRPIRPRRPRPAQPVAMQLWLVAGVAAVVLVLFTAFRGFQQNNQPQVEGAKVDQQKLADAARRELDRDSTNVEARIALADVLYDTGNWSEAILHYTAAARRDSMRVSTWVDLGVCYYNLGQAHFAEDRFQHALRLDPHHPVALFNLGIVHEQREEFDKALDFYHRAMNASPPENMRDPLMARMQQVMTKLGRSAPPLEGTRLPSTP